MHLRHHRDPSSEILNRKLSLKRFTILRSLKGLQVIHRQQPLECHQLVARRQLEVFHYPTEQAGLSFQTKTSRSVLRSKTPTSSIRVKRTRKRRRKRRTIAASNDKHSKRPLLTSRNFLPETLGAWRYCLW